MNLGQFSGYTGDVATATVAAPVMTVNMETIETLLSDVAAINNWPEQWWVNALLSLRTERGRPYLSLNNRPFIYEIVGCIQVHGFDYTIRHLQETRGTRDFYFDGRVFDTARENIVRELYTSLEPQKGSTKFGNCRNPSCRNPELEQFSKQTRGLDEPETDFLRCPACGWVWRM